MDNKTVTKLEIEELKKLGKYNRRNIKKLENYYPIQYLIGYVDFYGNKINVNKNVLIPRYETEYLIEKTLNYIKKLNIKNPKILDLCTGSGCIGLTLKKELNTKVVMSDISRKAIKVAKRNAKELSLDVKIMRSDLFKNIKDNDFDVIISNPPYVMVDEVLPKELSYEPKLALYAENNGTKIIEEIIKESKKHIKDNFLIAIEINEQSEKELTKIVKEYYEHFSFEKDLCSKTRYLFIMNKKVEN